MTAKTTTHAERVRIYLIAAGGITLMTIVNSLLLRSWAGLIQLAAAALFLGMAVHERREARKDDEAQTHLRYPWGYAG